MMIGTTLGDHPLFQALLEEYDATFKRGTF